MTLYDELVARGLIAQVTDEEEIKELINNGKAVFYIGFDPTADSLHVGHFMALCLMKRLQMAGNKPIALIGGGTAMIGDPSGRTDMRQMMTPETIQHNVDCFKKQMSRFIDFGEGKAMLVNNADWLMDLNYIDVLRDVGAHFSVNRMLTAECYKQRMEKGLSFLEFNYMIMQSYDFYTLYQKYGCNMEFGGDDQWSNMLGGTELIRRKLGKDAYAMTINLLLNSEGKKMGKTQSGAVLLAHDESISSEVVDEVVSKAVEEEEVVEIKTIESVLEEKKEIDTVSTIKTQRARVIQLIEDENSDEYTTYIVPEDELPEVIIIAGSKKVDGIIPPAISEMIGTKKAVSHSGNDESVDEKLLGAAMKYVESNISRSDLSVEELSRELGMSRVNLYKRLVAMTGKTPIEFIRVIRLKHAAKLLRETRMNISEVAYQVGFNNPKYFTKYFKEEFGMLPSVYQEKEKQEQGE